MDSLRQWISFSRQVHQDRVDPAHTLAFHLQSFMRRSSVWLNSHDFERASPLTRLVHLLLAVLVILHFVLMARYVVQHPIDTGNILDVCNSLSMLLGGLNSCFVLVVNGWNRGKVSALIAAIDAQVAVAKRTSGQRLSRERRWQFLALGWLVVGASCTGVCFCVLVLVHSCVSGEQAMPLWDCAPFSAAWWLNLAYTQLAANFVYVNFTLAEALALDHILQLAFLHRVQYERLQQLATGDWAQTRREFRAVCAELVALRQLTDAFLETIWLCKFFIWSVIYLALANSSVALMLAVDEGPVSVVRVVIYPAYGLLFLGLGAVVGGYFEDSTGRLNWSLYSSDWNEMPVSTRKMILILMSFGQDTPRLVVPPFYVINRELFAQLLKKTYSFYAILRNVMH